MNTPKPICTGQYSGQAFPGAGKGWPQVAIHVGEQHNKGNCVAIVHMGGSGGTSMQREDLEAFAQLIVHSVNTLPEVTAQRDALLNACKEFVARYENRGLGRFGNSILILEATYHKMSEAIALCEKGGQ